MNAQVWVDGAGMLIGSGVVAWLYNWLRTRRTAPTDNTVRLSAAAMAQVESAMRQVDQLQERAAAAEQNVAATERASAAARQEAEDARSETATVRREMRKVSAKAEELADRLDVLIQHIHDPYMTIERLRVMVPLPKPTNGTPST